MRFIARYAKDKGENFEIVTVWDKRIVTEFIDKEESCLKTLSYEHPAAIWFERKMKDDFGIKTVDAFDSRDLLHHEQFPKNIYPMLKNFQEKEIKYSDFVPYEYETINGDSIFQVSVGPVHAGIIEPGHFHFSQAGERILHLEVRHFYKYRAVEKMLEGKTLKEAKPIIERISGNETIAYQICWRDIFLQATRIKLPLSLKKQHAFLLELERIIHHLTDIGFIPNDAGFGAALAFASKLAEDARREMKKITNHRFGFGAIDLKYNNMDIKSITKWIEKLFEEVEFFQNWIMDIPSLWDRFDTTGILTMQKAVKYDTVGVVARASKVMVDRRLEPFYLENGFKISSEANGDVGARFKVRIDEIKNSLEMMKNFLVETENLNIEYKDSIDGKYISFCESSIGELFMAIDIKDGVIDRFFVRDPSFINWQTLHLMMTKDIIADFPLINKSCDLSYAGSDL